MMLNFAGRNMVKYHLDAYNNAYNIEQITRLFNNSGLNIISKEGNDKSWKYKIIAIKSKI